MANKAQKEKEKGNAAFKSGDYPAAIGHYTAAVLADRKDTTYPLNRAAAYLKLGKYEDAERDCSTVLDLSPKNVKAYFRRGQARVGLRKFIEAQRDFTEALRLEPDNSATKEELQKVAELIELDKRRKPGHRNVDLAFDSALHPTPTPKRRRVSITIIDSPVPSEKGHVAEVEQPEPFPEIPKATVESARPTSLPANGDLRESSSRPLKLSSVTEPKTQAPSSQPRTSAATSPSFAEAKQAREARTSKVGGGIFHASGQHTVFPAQDSSPVAPTHSKETPTAERQNEEKQAGVEERLSTPGASTPTTSPPKREPEPKLESKLPSTKFPSESIEPSVNDWLQSVATLFDFSRAWRTMFTSTERWKLLRTIPPSSLPSFCKTSLEPTLLVSILEVFLVVLSSQPTAEDTSKVREYMDNLGKVPRFPTLVMFFSGKEKALAKEVWRKLGVQASAPGVWSALGSLGS